MSRSGTMVVCLTIAACANGGSTPRRALVADDAGGTARGAGRLAPDSGARAASLPDAGRPDAPAPERDDAGAATDGPGCSPADAACTTGATCCGGTCDASGHCGRAECGARHETCHAHTECCDAPCTGGYCGGPERTGTCAIDNVSCWAHGQCCSGVCGVEGVCVVAAPPDRPCIAAHGGCFFGVDCCSGACLGFTNVCATPGPGPWLP